MSTLLNIVYAIAFLVVAASGLAIVFGLMGVINFAHGEFMMLGAYVAVWTSSFGSFWLALIFAPLAVGAISLIPERLLLRRFYHRTIETILATYGLSIVIQQVMVLVVGPQYRSIADPIGTSTSVLGTAYPVYQLVIVGFGVLIVAGLGYLVLRTRVGLRVRAVLDSPELAAGLGLNVNATYRAAFGVGSALAGLAGALLAPLVTIYPLMGPNFLVGSFLTVILGGSGSVLGFGFSATSLGTVQTLTTTWSTATAGLIAILLVVVVVMRVRTQGLAPR